MLIAGGGINDHGLPFYDDPRIAIIGFDIYTSELTKFIADGHSHLLSDGSVNGIIAQAVLERCRPLASCGRDSPSSQTWCHRLVRSAPHAAGA